MEPVDIPPGFRATDELERIIDAMDQDPDAAFTIERDGKPVAVLLPIAMADKLESMGAIKERLDE